MIKRISRLFLEKIKGALPSLFSILMGLLIGLLIMLISNPGQALMGFKTILLGGFTDGAKGAGEVLYYAAPLLMTGLSVGFAFKTGLFNIGASGQFIMGAFGAAYVGIKWTWLPAGLHCPVAVVAAMLLGGASALLPGLLKAYRNVNEVVSCIMTNYISVFLVNMLVVGTIYDSSKNQSLPIAKSAEMPKMGLELLFKGSSVNIGILLALLAAVATYIILNKTTFGYELKACGFNREASRYAGINTRRNLVLSMAISGVLAGLGGAILYLGGTGKHLVVVDVIPAEGFTGISIALLGLSNPLGIVLAALFISYITVGGFYLQMLNFPVQVVDMIIAAIIYFSAFVIFIQELAVYWRRRRQREEAKA